MSLEYNLSVWFRRTFGWVTSPQAWLEIGIGAALLAAAGTLWWFGGALPPLANVLLWALLAVVTLVLFRQGWLKLFGPVLFYDMVRSGRRGRHILMRVLYAGLLFLILWAVFWTHQDWFYRVGRQATPQDVARLTQSYFETFMICQLIAVLVLTPAYVAGAIADEKNRKTLEFLLATDLRSREIVLSKLVARLGQLTLFILTGLPVLSLLQFLGGVDPILIVSGFVATFMTMIGLGGISIFHSTYYRRPRNAIAVAYCTVIVYYAIALLVWLLYELLVRAPWAPLARSGLLTDSVTLVHEVINSGNLVYFLPKIVEAMRRGSLASDLPWFVLRYSAFMGVIGVGCTAWSIFRLRPIALRQASRARRRRPWRGLFSFRRPAVGNLPMLWKELHVEGGIHLNAFGWIIMFLLVLASFVPALLILCFFEVQRHSFVGGGYRYSAWDVLAQSMNVWVRGMTVLVGCLTLLAVAVRASACISGERDRQTLDSLLTTPMGSNEILIAKWLGNIASVRYSWLWLGAVYTLGIITGGLHPLAVPFILGSWLVYAAFVSILGCWCSMTSKTSLRATVWTLVATVGLGVGHWLFCGICYAMVGFLHAGQELGYAARFEAGLTPPYVLGLMPFTYLDFRVPDYLPRSYGNMFYEQLVFAFIGLGFWMFLTAILWTVTTARFRRLTFRERNWYLETHRLSAAGAAQRRDLADAEALLVTPIAASGVPEAQLRGATLVEESWQAPRRPQEEAEQE